MIDDILVDLDTGQPIAQSPYPRIIPGQNGSFMEQPRVTNIPQFGQDQPQPEAGRVPRPGEDIPQGGEIPGAGGVAPAFGAGVPMTVEDRSSAYPADNPNTAVREPPRRADPRAASLPMGNPLDSQMGGGVEVVRVRSRQEAERLPPGTRYMTPQGAVFVR